ncbi:MAG: sugar phosphate isomerase/epimerase [Clostridia bacterium]|nr:sugar phosphate isomerase/epimerase [Clostridia bacterium]
MKLSVSNIAWESAKAEEAYSMMTKYGFSGLEIAPPAVVGDNPYDKIADAVNWFDDLHFKYSFDISSMQSIWFKRTENLFISPNDSTVLLQYTKKAILFAEALGCKNLVFGCPKNRNIPDGMTSDDSLEFITEIAEFATKHNTVFSMEANPTIYNTNFINTTEEALEIVKKVNSNGFKVNLDIGTMIQNNESADIIREYVKYINHVHISEPYLKPIVKRVLHSEIANILKSEGYSGYVSLEMGKSSDMSLTDMENSMKYISEVFGC